MSNGDMPQVGEFCWNELMTPDTQKAKEFYTALFGWKVQEMEDMNYTIFMAGEKGVGGMMATPKEKVGQVPPHWMSYICVEDVDKTLAKAKSLGATEKVPVTEVKDMGRLAIIMDPTGAHIAFWQSMKKM